MRKKRDIFPYTAPRSHLLEGDVFSHRGVGARAFIALNDVSANLPNHLDCVEVSLFEVRTNGVFSGKIKLTARNILEYLVRDGESWQPDHVGVAIDDPRRRRRNTIRTSSCVVFCRVKVDRAPLPGKQSRLIIGSAKTLVQATFEW